METQTLTIHFGALAPALSDQLRNQNMQFDEKKLKLYERINESITLLYFQGMINDSDHKKLENKLFTNIKRHVTTETKKTR